MRVDVPARAHFLCGAPRFHFAPSCARLSKKRQMQTAPLEASSKGQQQFPARITSRNARILHRFTMPLWTQTSTFITFFLTHSPHPGPCQPHLAALLYVLALTTAIVCSAASCCSNQRPDGNRQRPGRRRLARPQALIPHSRQLSTAHPHVGISQCTRTWALANASTQSTPPACPIATYHSVSLSVCRPPSLSVVCALSTHTNTHTPECGPRAPPRVTRLRKHAVFRSRNLRKNACQHSCRREVACVGCAREVFYCACVIIALSPHRSPPSLPPFLPPSSRRSISVPPFRHYHSNTPHGRFLNALLEDLIF